jgi:hypothetical protein
MAQFWQLCMCHLVVKVVGSKASPWNAQTHSVLCAPRVAPEHRANNCSIAHTFALSPLGQAASTCCPRVHFDRLSQTHNVFLALSPVPLLLPSECAIRAASPPMDCCRCLERHQLGCLEASFPIAFFRAAAATGSGCTQLVWRQREPCFAFKCGPWHLHSIRLE